MTAPRPVRVAVVGGGCAALTAAFELTRPELGGRFEVTVYQMGWRLGGKGASGRGPEGRIEEHGLHLWLGFYENAFRLMREVWEAAGRDPAICPIATFSQAFQPADHVALADRGLDGELQPWLARFPPGAGAPGEPLQDQNPLSAAGYLARTAALLVELLRSALPDAAAEPAAGLPAPAELPRAASALLRYGELAGTAALLHGAELLGALLAVATSGPRAPEPGVGGPLVELVGALSRGVRARLEALSRRDTAVRRTWEVGDTVLAILRGMLVDGLAWDERGFDAIDHWEWRDWLRHHGAAERSLDSAFMRGIYDLAFAFEAGDTARPRLSAAVALRGAMRMFFTYRGALFWRMAAGMGDIVFAPTYEVLRRRGVRFEFFHRLAEVELNPAGEERSLVRALRFDVQAKVRGGRAYEPLVPVRGLPCWPSEPRWEQLVGGAALRRQGVELESPWESRVRGQRVLRVGEDFDFVVLGASVAALRGPTAALSERSPRWRAMIEGLQTVATQSLQLWTRPDVAGLGWTRPSVNLSGWVEPFDTWADMSHLLPLEDWRDAPGAIAYFCSPLADPRGEDGAVRPAADEADHRAARARVRAAAEGFLDRDLPELWPKARGEGGAFDWSLLAVPSAARAAAEPEGPARLDQQFWMANVRPSERYVLSLPGTSHLRVSPLELLFDNLTVAGDWTASGLNSGCVESAVMSGKLAAHALSGSPSLDSIVGYDHP